MIKHALDTLSENLTKDGHVFRMDRKVYRPEETEFLDHVYHWETGDREKAEPYILEHYNNIIAFKFEINYLTNFYLWYNTETGHFSYCGYNLGSSTPNPDNIGGIFEDVCEEFNEKDLKEALK